MTRSPLSDVSPNIGLRRNISRNNSSSFVKQYFLAASAPALETVDSDRLRLASGWLDAVDCLRFKGPLGPGDAETVRVRVLVEAALGRRVDFVDFLGCEESSELDSESLGATCPRRRCIYSLRVNKGNNIQ